MPRAESLDALYDRIRRIESPARHGVLPFGVAEIDRALPGGGLALGAVHEILGADGDEEDGAAAAGFVAGILARLGNRPVLWCLKRPDLYGPGLAEHGLDPARLVLVVAKRDDEILWAMEEGLRAPGLAAVIGEVGRLPMVAGRRLQLAAERSGVTAFLLRRWRNAEEAARERERPSAALTRWRIAALPSYPHASSASRRTLSPAKLLPLPPLAGGEGWGEGGYGTALAAPLTLPSPPSGGRGFEKGGGGLGWGLGIPRWRVELLRCRGGVPAQWVVEPGEVEVADATGHVSLSATLADRPAAPPRREADRIAPAEPFRRAG